MVYNICMSFRNALRLLLSKFSLVWSVALYLLVIGGMLVSFVVMLWYPVFNHVVDLGLFAQIGEGLSDFLNGDATLMKFFDAASASINTILETVAGYPWTITLTITCIFFLGRVLYGYKDLALCTSINYQMSANMHHPILRSFRSTFKQATQLVFSRVLFTIPFDFLMGLVMLLTYKGCLAIGVRVIIPFAMMTEYALLASFKKMLFELWPTFIVVEGNRTFSAMRRALRLVFKKSARIYSLMFVTRLAAIVFIVFSTVFSFGLGLLVALPTCVVFQQLLNMVILYTHTGRRFYLDPSTVYVPPSYLYEGARSQTSFPPANDRGIVVELNSDFEQLAPPPKSKSKKKRDEKK